MGSNKYEPIESRVRLNLRQKREPCSVPPPEHGSTRESIAPAGQSCNLTKRAVGNSVRCKCRISSVVPRTHPQSAQHSMRHDFADRRDRIRIDVGEHFHRRRTRKGKMGPPPARHDLLFPRTRPCSRSVTKQNAHHRLHLLVARGWLFEPRRSKNGEA